MILRWTPEPGAPSRDLIFKPEELLSPDAEPIEAAGAGAWQTFDGWHHLFKNGHKRAERVALWIARRWEEPGLTLDNVSVRMDALTVHFDLDEIRARRAALRAIPFDDDWTPDALERTLSRAYLALPEGEEDPGPLEPSNEPSSTTPTPSGEPDTDSPSPAS